MTGAWRWCALATLPLICSWSAFTLATPTPQRARDAAALLEKIEGENEPTAFADMACTLANTTSLPFCDTSLSIDERVRDLISRIHDDEKPALMTARGPGGHLKSIPRLGVPAYYWGTNCMHSIYLGCMSWNKTSLCPTNFPSGPSMAATFDQQAIHDIARATSRELRGLFNGGLGMGSLNCWGPVINLNRDPRWGRNGEGGAEDPLLMGMIAYNWGIGFQQDNDTDKNHMLGVVTLKHMDANSLENSDGYLRDNYNVNVTKGMLADYYLVPFKHGIRDGGASGVMCSYNAVRGVPTCLSPLMKNARKDWGFDGYVVSDTDAVYDACYAHHYSPSLDSASCQAVTAGQCDMNSGDTFNQTLLAGVAKGECAMSDVDRALYNNLKMRFRLGLFDPVAKQPFFQIPPTEVGKPENQQLSAEVSQKSIVLLRNDDVLPVKPGIKIAVVGPQTHSQLTMVQPYPSFPTCGANDNSLDCVSSVLTAITNENIGGVTQGATGCEIFFGPIANGTDSYDQAMALAKEADLVVLGLGIETCGMDPNHNKAHGGGCLYAHNTKDYVYPDQYLEMEGHDRTTIDLPEVQHTFAEQILALGRPTVIYLLNAGMVSVERELSAAKQGQLAVIEAFYPGPKGAEAISGAIFGSHNRFGRLPYTIYPAEFVNATMMSEHDLTVAPGRTYRYYQHEPVFPFGFGLSLSTFSVQAVATTPTQIQTNSASSSISFTITLTNHGPLVGDVVLTVCFKPQKPLSQNPALKKHMFYFYRANDVAVGANHAITMTITREHLAVTDMDSGDIVSTAGSFLVVFETGRGEQSAATTQLVSVVGDTVVLEPFPSETEQA